MKIADVKCIVGQLSQVNSELLDQITSVIKPCYSDYQALIEREERHCKKTYYLKNSEDKLIAFFMVNEEKIGDVNSFYCGLSGVNTQMQSTGKSMLVYLKFIQETLELQRSSGKKYRLYATTISPIPFIIIHKIFSNVEPRLDGSFSQSGSQKATDYVKAFNIISDSGHPFVFQGIVKNTKYSEIELMRQEGFSTKNNFTLFKELNISDNNGDRLLTVFDLPSPDKFSQLLEHYS